MDVGGMNRVALRPRRFSGRYPFLSETPRRFSRCNFQSEYFRRPATVPGTFSSRVFLRFHGFPNFPLVTHIRDCVRADKDNPRRRYSPRLPRVLFQTRASISTRRFRSAAFGEESRAETRESGRGRLCAGKIQIDRSLARAPLRFCIAN